MFAVLNQSGSILRLTSLQTAGTKINIMNTLRNKVQLIGRLGKVFCSSKELVSFTFSQGTLVKVKYFGFGECHFTEHFTFK